MAIRDFSINDIINEQIKNADINVDGYNAADNTADNTANNTADIADTANVASTNEIQKSEDNEIQKAENIPVKYKGGETESDKNGQPYQTKSSNILKRIDKEPEVIKAIKGEPENNYEWAQDAAQEISDTGKSYEEVEKNLANKYKQIGRAHV